jgi:hypothetical protein
MVISPEDGLLMYGINTGRSHTGCPNLLSGVEGPASCNQIAEWVGKI